MIEKLDLNKRHSFGTLDWLEHWNEPSGAKLIENKINELIDIVNALIEENNIHEKQIDELQMKLRPIIEERESGIKVYEEAQNMFDNAILDGIKDKKVDVTILPKDPYAEQRKWIGCLVRYKVCDFQGGWYTDVLDEIVDHPIYPFKMRNGETAQVCEVVKPEEIYPNKARTW